MRNRFENDCTESQTITPHQIARKKKLESFRWLQLACCRGKAVEANVVEIALAGSLGRPGMFISQQASALDATLTCEATATFARNVYPLELI
jgi:hypothetical protein